MEREILVEGAAEVRVPPDRAIVHATVDADGPDRDEAYRAAAAAAADVDAVLADHAAAIDRTTTAALLVQPLTRWRDGESLRTGWRATRQTALEVTDFERFGELLAALAAAEAALAGPTWRVDAANPAHHRVRREAAADARRRAVAYADGIGLAVGTVLWMAEPGLRAPEDGRPGRGAELMAAMAVPMAPDAPTIDVAPDELTIRAAVEVAFALVGS